MLTKRQEDILKLIVMEYIKLAKPVGSKLICDRLNCSSATVRNEMAELENFGLLEKTHTSSGRVPSEKGYRYYVDNLMELKELNGEDVFKLQTIFNNSQLELNDVLNKSLELISDMTSYTSIVLDAKSHENKLKEISVVPINQDVVIVIVVTDKGYVEHKDIEIKGVGLEEVKKTVKLINDLIIGTPIDEVSAKLEFEIKPIIGKYVKQHEVLYNAFYDVFTDISSKNISVVGKNNILKHQEFNSLDKVKDIFNKLDDMEVLENIDESEKNNDINVYIGHENAVSPDVTVIKTNYKTNKDEGTIAIVGPKRMEYSKVVNLLDYIKKQIER
ncbi:MAG: heat-inducible transcriptional repressor HrcA [Erysipelotrichaceae bacterium]|nr:heat-inducible transcriptional repressor HrcA [Erysipelotrichaceae bacterium]